MNIVSVAVGAQYELEVQRLTKAYPQTIVITERTPGVETFFELPLLNGLATKCKFGLLIPKDLQGPILFCDADLYPVIKNPLQYFKVKEETDIAYVVYPGIWHFPPRLKDFERAIRKTGKINSGFMYFRNIDICQDVCFKWHKKYIERMNEYLSGKVEGDRKGEFDEPSLVFVLEKENYNLEFLDPKWNVWGNIITVQNSLSHNISDCYFRQDHLGWDPYIANPGIY
jgi:hypothetical protein